MIRRALGATPPASPTSGTLVVDAATVTSTTTTGTPSVAGTFRSLTPSRLLDTRFGVGAPSAAVAPWGTVHLQVTGRSGVPDYGVSAVVLNVTVTQPYWPGYIAVHGDVP